MYDPLNSGFNNASANDTLNPQWSSPPHTPKQSLPPGDGLPTTPGFIAASPVQPQTPQQSSLRGPFGREPQIYGQPEPGLISPATNKASNGQSFERSEPYLRVRITGLDRNRRDILIKFDAQTNLPNFTGQTYRNISRSYYEFRQFAEQIVYSNPQTIIPALPLSQTSAPSDDEDDRLVKYMLQRWFSRICEDPFILQDEELRLFIESDFGYQPTPHPRRKSGSGFSLLKRGVPDEDEDLQRARFELTKLETQYFDVARSVDRLARARKSLSVAQAEMGNKLVNVSTSESHPSLANAFKKFGRAWHSLADLDQAQAISECVVLGDSMGYQGLNARSAKETLLQRATVLEEHHTAVKSTITKRRQIERLKASSNIRPDKVDEALEELEEATKFEEMLAQRVEGISQNLHRGLYRHSKLVQDDVIVALIENARSSILYEKQMLRELESLRNDFNNAAKAAPMTAQPIVATMPTIRPLTPPQAQSGSWTVPKKTENTVPQLGQGSPVRAPPLQPPASTILSKHSLPPIHAQHTGSTLSVAIQGSISSDAISPNRNPLQSTGPTTYTTVSAPPSAIAGPGYIEKQTFLNGPLSSPGAGPSNVRSTITTFSSARVTGIGEASSSSYSTSSQLASPFPATLRHVDGTKSMVLPPAAGNSEHTQVPPALGSGASGFDPLVFPGSGFNNTSTSSSAGIANGNGHQYHHPLAASMAAIPSTGAQTHADNTVENMQGSKYGTMRRRLDAREAAAKLANFL